MRRVNSFGYTYDPHATFSGIAQDPKCLQAIHLAPNTAPLSYIIEELWPALDFLPFDQEWEGKKLQSEFILNEFIIKHSNSLEVLNLLPFKELFNNSVDPGVYRYCEHRYKPDSPGAALNALLQWEADERAASYDVDEEGVTADATLVNMVRESHGI